MSIAGILAAMTLVGVSLALVKLGMQISGINSPGNWWLTVGITCAGSSAASLIILPPVCALVLRVRSWTAGFLLSLLYLAGISILAAITTLSITGRGRGEPFGTLLSLLTTFCGFAFGLLLPLLLLRLANYRLQWGRE